MNRKKLFCFRYRLRSKEKVTYALLRLEQYEESKPKDATVIEM